MVLKAGEKIHVIVRRRWEDDVRRHFVGEVTEATENVSRVKGYVFVFNAAKYEKVKRPELRDRIVSLTDSGNIINIIPTTVDLDKVSYQMSKERRLIFTDGEFSLDVNEFGASF
ncbi:MAG: hypothetical protein JSV01_06125 [Desulfobacterales bacterium]|nr:MAG: hypothetical protein JSV01_06125 [Desulfobacterales bacterium]